MIYRWSTSLFCVISNQSTPSFQGRVETNQYFMFTGSIFSLGLTSLVCHVCKGYLRHGLLCGQISIVGDLGH